MMAEGPLEIGVVRSELAEFEHLHRLHGRLFVLAAFA
jgi:hypothetical protein